MWSVLLPAFVSGILLLSVCSDGLQAEELGEYVERRVALSVTSNSKSIVIPNHERTARFDFKIENPNVQDVRVTKITSSCGCISVELEPSRDTIPAFQAARLKALIDLRGKSGTIYKLISLESEVGALLFAMQVKILPPLTAEEREVNRKLAIQDRQAVFKGDCRRCHYDSAKDKEGEALYRSVCGICHDSPTRASDVPSLTSLSPRDPAKLHQEIAQGINLMPAFEMDAGGPLTVQQIESLVDYLISRK